MMQKRGGNVEVDRERLSVKGEDEEIIHIENVIV